MLAVFGEPRASGMNAGVLAHLKFENSARALHPRVPLVIRFTGRNSMLRSRHCGTASRSELEPVPAILRETSGGTSY